MDKAKELEVVAKELHELKQKVCCCCCCHCLLACYHTLTVCGLQYKSLETESNDQMEVCVVLILWSIVEDSCCCCC
jgi:hypothetical protein